MQLTRLFFENYKAFDQEYEKEAFEIFERLNSRGVAIIR